MPPHGYATAGWLGCEGEAAKPVWHRNRAALVIDKGVLGHARGKKCCLVLVPYLIYKAHGCAPPFRNAGAYKYKVVIAGRRAVTALSLAHGQNKAPFFHFGIAHAATANIFAARTFEQV